MVTILLYILVLSFLSLFYIPGRGIISFMESIFLWPDN